MLLFTKTRCVMGSPLTWLIFIYAIDSFSYIFGVGGTYFCNLASRCKRLRSTLLSFVHESKQVF